MNRVRRASLLTAVTSVVLTAACGAVVGIEPLEEVMTPSSSTDSGTIIDAGGLLDSAIVITEGDADAGYIAPPPRPLEGTYNYITVDTGWRLERTFPFSGSYSAGSLKVEYLSDSACFKQTLTLVNGYSETLDTFCVNGLTLATTSGRRSQNLPVAGEVVTNTVCDAGDVYFSTALSPNKTWQHDCAGTNTESKSGDSGFTTKGPYRFVGLDTVLVGADKTPVSTLHFRDERQVSGQQVGTNIADWWFAPQTALLVRLVRDVSVDYTTNFGPVRYIEHVDVTLEKPPP